MRAKIAENSSTINHEGRRGAVRRAGRGNEVNSLTNAYDLVGEREGVTS